MVSKRFKLSRIKKKYLECKFKVASREVNMEVRLAAQIISKRKF